MYASAAVLAAVFAVRLLTPCMERRYSPFVRRNVLREMSKLANSLKKQGLQKSFSRDFDPDHACEIFSSFLAGLSPLFSSSYSLSN